MSDKLSVNKLKFFRQVAIVMLAAFLFASLPACSAQQTPEETPDPTVVKTFAPPTETPPPTSPPTEPPTSPPSPTPSPTLNVSFPPFKADSSGDYIFPQVVADKTEAMTNEPVYFKILTSDKVKSIQTVIDNEDGKVNKEYTTDNGKRVWQARIIFTKDGSRKVQFKCAMESGGNAVIPQNPVKISVTFKYTAESTSKNIAKGKTVTFTLKTPATIDSIYAVVDGVNQKIKYNKPESSEGGVSIWKINIMFSKLGTRAVTFEAYDGTKLKKTFPDPGITIIVE